MTNMDILAAIDAAVDCQQCGETLLGSVSDDFCGPLCQEGWHASNAVPLVDYREPWYRPWDFPGVGTEVAISGHGRHWQELGRVAEGSTFTTHTVDSSMLPPNPDPPAGFGPRVGRIQVSWPSARITVGSVIHTRNTEFRLPRSTGDLSADLVAARRASTCATTDEQRAAVALRMESLADRQAESYQRMWGSIGVSINVAFEQFAVVLRSMSDALARALPSAVQPARDVEADRWSQPADVREQALQLRRSRNTGPPSSRRAPRTIGRPTSSPRS